MKEKKFSAVLTAEKNSSKALESVAKKITADFSGQPPDLLLLFVSEKYARFDPLQAGKYLQKTTGARMMLGCNSSGVIGGAQEIEMESAMSALALYLPEVMLHPFTLSPQEIEMTHSGKDLQKRLDLYPTDKPQFLLLGDSQTCDITKLLGLYNQGYPGAPVQGGLASGLVAGQENWLLLNGEIYDQGAAGISLSGPLEIETLVSQGCRPIGEPFAITRSEGNILFELGGRPVLDVFRDLFTTLSPEDKALAQHSLFVGLAMDENLSQFKRGDFLIRNIVSIDSSQGALGIGENLITGQTFQFHLRDAQTSSEDLELLLKQAAARPRASSEGALLVSCAGRGRGLFGDPDHDAQMVQKIRGPLALSGFFANGELGLIRGRNYIHGYTSSLTLFC